MKALQGFIDCGMGSEDRRSLQAACETQLRSAFIDDHFMKQWKEKRGMKLKCVRVDNGGEYIGPFENYCRTHRIKLEKTIPKTPQQNGLAEKMNRTIVERVWTGKEVSYKHLKVFGCRASVHIPREFEYRFWDPDNRKIIRSRDVVFFEDQTIKDLHKLEKARIFDSTVKSDEHMALLKIQSSPIAIAAALTIASMIQILCIYPTLIYLAASYYSKIHALEKNTCRRYFSWDIILPSTNFMTDKSITAFLSRVQDRIKARAKIQEWIHRNFRATIGRLNTRFSTVLLNSVHPQNIWYCYRNRAARLQLLQLLQEDLRYA
ncbi:hypothetical protein CRG98_029093 [Punica granatum]|uniref:Integrase catalytic domain-containing protein n=1 Tax=Punica granatum TaxID=22663 RepID=A0A2I0J2M4_PUNGR|nr:hypothetical protein CRG98_029093 [Punica granatum]